MPRQREDPFQRGLQQVLAFFLAAGQQYRRAQQPLAAFGEETFQFRHVRWFAWHAILRRVTSNATGAEERLTA
jgi:hypothetical protein